MAGHLSACLPAVHPFQPSDGVWRKKERKGRQADGAVCMKYLLYGSTATTWLQPHQPRTTLMFFFKKKKNAKHDSFFFFFGFQVVVVSKVKGGRGWLALLAIVLWSWGGPAKPKQAISLFLILSHSTLKPSKPAASFSYLQPSGSC